MAKLPDKFRILLVEQLIECADDAIGYPRTYLGMSQLGHECPRYLYYSFRWCFTEKLSPRLQRIFERGNWEEERIIRDLKAVGCDIQDEQFTIKYSEHILGHCDGVATNIPGFRATQRHVLEIKTMKASSYKELTQKSLKSANYIYYIQALVYMYMLKAPRCLHITTNKDTEERYYEIVRQDNDTAEHYLMRAEDIVHATVPPPKISDKPEWFKCRYCPAKETCHYGKPPERNCRTCEHVQVTQEHWYCKRHSIILETKYQINGCDGYTLASVLSTGSHTESL
jgi:hypothetical protein